MEKAFLKYQKEKEQKNLMTYPSKFTDFFFFFSEKGYFIGISFRQYVQSVANAYSKKKKTKKTLH